MMLLHHSLSLILTCGLLLCGKPPVLSQISSKPNPAEELVFRSTNFHMPPPRRLHPVVLPDGGLLISVGDTVYKVDIEGKLSWKFSGGIGLTSEPAFNLDQNEIAVIGYDLLFVRLDANSGKTKWKAPTVGRAVFSAIAPYGKGYLVVADMSGYRENEKGLGLKEPTLDRLEYWGESEKDFWSIAFPIGAELVVNGKKIYALRNVRGVIRLRKLYPPGTR